ncbi:MAG TPA: PKD domain-containing protein, partial [Candidatus Acidoferrales bacterium]|nr:PKD domain-containing protein [Candidatus Acidoferrales bacterium]
SVWTNVLVNRFAGYDGLITGHASWVQWAFGDGTTVSNTGAAASHEWTNAGNYTVTFTAYNNDNPQGVAANFPVVVLPLAMPQLLAPVLTTNGIQFQFSGQTLADYTVQFSTNLVPPVAWQNLSTIYFNEQDTVQISDPSATNTTRFYRVLVQ